MQDKNDDLTLSASQQYTTLEFVQSPMPGVSRGSLDRKGAEKARATTLVRYEPSRSFSSHIHSGGEEFLVLEGTFVDQKGSYPVGTYVRNPVGSAHAPWVGADGCLILVKLCFMHPDDPLHVIRDATSIPDGIKERALFKSECTTESVSVVRLDSGEEIVGGAGHKGLEILVLEGSVLYQGSVFEKYGWIRIAAGDLNAITGGKIGARLYVKRDHLESHSIDF
ncbi:anti-ECFsigma factor, ChrR [Chytriomyces sp. MP71]|nr:anti-ECFsigma factor, ChrR [Chytriomyces sp. MP71]